MPALLPLACGFRLGLRMLIVDGVRFAIWVKGVFDRIECQCLSLFVGYLGVRSLAPCKPKRAVSGLE